MASSRALVGDSLQAVCVRPDLPCSRTRFLEFSKRQEKLKSGNCEEDNDPPALEETTQSSIEDTSG